MRTEFFLASRMRLGAPDASGHYHTAPGVRIAVGGVALSFAIMLLAIAVVTGFKHEITRKVTGFEQQITIYPQVIEPGAVNTGISLSPAISRAIAQAAPGAVATPALHQPAILKTDSDFEGLVIKGIAPGASDSAFIAPQLLRGRMPRPGERPELTVSESTARALGIDTADRVFAHFFINGDIYTRRFDVCGVYDTHFSDFDRLRAFTFISALQELNGVDSLTGSSLELNGIEAARIEPAAQELRVALTAIGHSSTPMTIYRVDSVHDSGALYFSWLALLDTNVWVILVLMGCVAAFTLISSLFIIVLDRVRTIGLLKAIGAPDGLIRRTFILMAAKITVAGLVIGNIAAIGIILLQRATHFLPLDANSYYLNYVPAEISAVTVVTLNVAVAALSLLLLVLPSHIICTLSPAEAMRRD